MDGMDAMSGREGITLRHLRSLWRLLVSSVEKPGTLQGILLPTAHLTTCRGQKLPPVGFAFSYHSIVGLEGTLQTI